MLWARELAWLKYLLSKHKAWIPIPRAHIMGSIANITVKYIAHL